jgi:SSS family transporter
LSQSHPIEYFVIALYLGVLIGLAFVFRRFNQNVDDYFRNGCRGSWWLVGSSAFVANFTAWTFTGAAGVAFIAGWSVMVIFMIAPMVALITALFFADKFRQIRAITAPEVLRRRFGGATEQFYSYFGILNNLLISSIQLYGLAIFSSAIFGFEIHLVIIFIGLVVLTYSLFGGSWAVMGTDFIQGLILVPVTLFVCALCLVEIGGIGQMFHLIQEKGLQADFQMFNTDQFEGRLSDFTWAWAIAMLMKNIPGQLSLITSVRFFAVKDGREARKAALLDCVLSTTGLLVWFIPPITARLLFESEVLAMDLAKPAESAYAVAAMQLLPAGMSGLMVVAMLAATMSNLDTGLNRNAAIFTLNIYPLIARLTKHEPLKGKALMRLGQLWTLLLGGCIIVLAIFLSQQEGKGVFDFLLEVGAILGMPMAVPMLLALLIKRVPSWAALVSIGVTAIPSTCAALAGRAPWLAEWLPFLSESWQFQTIVFINGTVSVTTFLLSLLFWKTTDAAYREKVDIFFKTMRTPVNFAEEVGEDKDDQQLTIIGSFLMIIGAGILLLMLVENPWALQGRIGILLLGGGIFGIGSLFLYLGRRAKQVEHSQEASEDE